MGGALKDNSKLKKEKTVKMKTIIYMLPPFSCALLLNQAAFHLHSVLCSAADAHV